MIKIVIATTNLHKLREFKEMFRQLSQFEVFSFHQFPDYHPPEETGETFRENAILKAVHAAEELNCWVLADDSGLIVPSLNGAPGVRSARYADEEATDADNRTKLLQKMKDFTGEQRIAYFECTLALANPLGLQKCVEGICEGYITSEPRGGHGFGYDPLFVKNDYDKTFAELDESLKNRISHRHKAFERMVAFLMRVLDQGNL